MEKLYDFWITVQDLSEAQSKELWLQHRTNTIHCTVFPTKAFIYGVASEPKITSIIDDIVKLGKDYGLTRTEMK